MAARGGPSACSRPSLRLPSARFLNGRIAMRSILDIILLVLQLYIWLLIAAAVLSWLVAFNVVNTRNQVVSMVGEFLYRITEPLLRPIRNMLPNLGGIDISPVILILVILLVENVIVRYIYPNVF
jgi:YggT family protein